MFTVLQKCQQSDASVSFSYFHNYWIFKNSFPLHTSIFLDLTKVGMKQTESDLGAEIRFLSTNSPNWEFSSQRVYWKVYWLFWVPENLTMFSNVTLDLTIWSRLIALCSRNGLLNRITCLLAVCYSTFRCLLLLKSVWKGHSVVIKEKGMWVLLKPLSVTINGWLYMWHSLWENI